MSYFLHPHLSGLLTAAKTMYQQKNGQNLQPGKKSKIEEVFFRPACYASQKALLDFSQTRWPVPHP
jgi:hypothetical protein